MACIDPANFQGDLLLSAKLSTKGGEVFSCGLQAMVYMNGHDLSGKQLGTSQQQSRRVRAAAKSHRQRQLGRKTAERRLQRYRQVAGQALDGKKRRCPHSNFFPTSFRPTTGYCRVLGGQQVTLSI